MESKQLKELKLGEFFKRKPDASGVFIRSEYQRDSKRYQCDSCADIWGNGLLLKGSTVVFIGFDY